MALVCTGILASTAVALAPGWVTDRTAAQRLDGETRVIAELVSAQIDAASAIMAEAAKGLDGVPVDPQILPQRLNTGAERLGGIVTDAVLSGVIDVGGPQEGATDERRIGISQLVRFDPATGTAEQFRMSMGDKIAATLDGLGLQWWPPKAETRIVAYPSAELPTEAGMATMDAADDTRVRQSGTG